jgi:hypothetical protein
MLLLFYLFQKIKIKALFSYFKPPETVTCVVIVHSCSYSNFNKERSGFTAFLPFFSKKIVKTIDFYTIPSASMKDLSSLAFLNDFRLLKV